MVDGGGAAALVVVVGAGAGAGGVGLGCCCFPLHQLCRNAIPKNTATTIRATAHPGRSSSDGEKNV